MDPFARKVLELLLSHNDAAPVRPVETPSPDRGWLHAALENAWWVGAQRSAARGLWARGHWRVRSTSRVIPELAHAVTCSDEACEYSIHEARLRFIEGKVVIEQPSHAEIGHLVRWREGALGSMTGDDWVQPGDRYVWVLSDTLPHPRTLEEKLSNAPSCEALFEALQTLVVIEIEVYESDDVTVSEPHHT